MAKDCSETVNSYHYICADFGLEDLHRKRLKIVRHRDMNDPFEARAIQSLTKEDSIKCAKLAEYVNKCAPFVSCSLESNNLLLWSHYADRHRGICIGFQISEDCVRKVCYERVRCSLLTGIVYTPEQQDKPVHAAIAVKSHHWKYERKIRVNVKVDESVRKFEFTKFSDKMRLREVILGYQCTASSECLERKSPCKKRCDAELVAR